MIESGQISSTCDVEFLPRPLPLPPLAYTYRRRDSQSNIVAIFCNGYAQSMRDNRLAMEVEKFLDHYYPFIHFDYTGVGNSMFALAKGNNDKYEVKSALDDESVKRAMLDNTLPSSMSYSRTNVPDQMRADNINEWNFGTWRRDLLTVLRRLLTYGQRALLIANDIGVWLAMLAAMRCPDMIHSIVCLSTNIDTFRRFFDVHMNADQRGRIGNGQLGVLANLYDVPVAINRTLVEHSRPYHLLSMKASPLPITCPIRFVHYFADKICELETIMQLSQRLATNDIQFHIFNVGNRYFTNESSLHLVFFTIASLIPNNHRLMQQLHEIMLIRKAKVSVDDGEYDSEAEIIENLSNTTKQKHIEIYRYPIRQDKAIRKNPKRWDFEEEKVKIDDSNESIESKFATVIRYFGAVRLDQK